MKIEKRCGAGSPEEPEAKSQKPVVIYIMILFIAAFLLMALSFFVHQRSNTEALGQLQSSVSAMQEMQETQEHVLQLQKELALANEKIDELSEYKGALEQAETNLNQAKQSLEDYKEAVEAFWALNEAYLANDLEQCRTILAQYQEHNGDRPLAGFSGKVGERFQEIMDALEPLPEEGSSSENKTN